MRDLAWGGRKSEHTAKVTSCQDSNPGPLGPKTRDASQSSQRAPPALLLALSTGKLKEEGPLLSQLALGSLLSPRGELF